MKIRKMRLEDSDRVLELVKELATFENSPEKVTNTASKMKQEYDQFHCLVAETNNLKIAGFALYFFSYYTWVGKSIYLDDLYVKPMFRGKKIGTSLLKKVMEIAIKENCNRVRWQVLDWNREAISFYKNFNVNMDSEWINCDVDVKAWKKTL